MAFQQREAKKIEEKNSSILDPELLKAETAKAQMVLAGLENLGKKVGGGPHMGDRDAALLARLAKEGSGR